MPETKPDPMPLPSLSPSSPSPETATSLDADEANSCADDLPEMRDRFETGVRILKKGLARLKGALTRFRTASSNVETMLGAAAGGAGSRAKRKAAADANALAEAKQAAGQSGRKLRAAMSQWDALFHDFHDGLPKRLCPAVRRVLFADWKLGEQTRVGMGMPPKEEGESEVMKALRQLDEEELLNVGVLRDVHDLTILFRLDLQWPNLRSIEKQGLTAFEAFSKEAKETPASFRLRPRETPEVVSAIQDALRWHERPFAERLVASAGEDEEACEMRLYCNSLLDSQEMPESGGPNMGTTPAQLHELLRDRWPDVGETKVNTGLAEAFKAGLVRVNGGDAAYRAGYAPKELGEIVDPMCLSRWLAMDSRSRPFEIRLYSVVSPAESQEDAAGRQGEKATEEPVPKCCVQIGELGDHPVVFGRRQKEKLTERQYAVIKAMISVWPERLSLSDLTTMTRRSEPHASLRELRESSEDWRRAIEMAGRSYRGYALASDPPSGS